MGNQMKHGLGLAAGQAMARTATAVCFALTFAAPLHADTTVYDNEADFLGAAPPLTMESYEDLPVDNQSSQHSSLTLPDFVVSTPGVDLSVNDIDVFGQYATDGNNYVRVTGAQSFTIVFNETQNAFGISLIDWGDFGEGDVLTYTDNAGHQFVAATSPLPDGNLLFFGIISDEAFSDLSFSHGISGESWAFDETYYGVPEPITVALLGLGACALIRRRR